MTAIDSDAGGRRLHCAHGGPQLLCQSSGFAKDVHTLFMPAIPTRRESDRASDRSPLLAAAAAAAAAATSIRTPLEHQAHSPY